MSGWRTRTESGTPTLRGYKMNVKVCMDSYMAWNGSCFMVTWTIFKNYLLEVGSNNTGRTMALRTLTTIDLFYLIMCEDPAWIEVHWNSIWLRNWSHVTSHYTWGDPWPHHIILEVCWDGLWTLSFGLSQCHGHGSWFVCEVALSPIGASESIQIKQS